VRLNRCLKSAAIYATGVWASLTAWAALAQYVLPGRGQALGKLGAFHWVLWINLVPALLCALGFAAGWSLVRRPTTAGRTRWRLALLLGLLFPLTALLLRPLFGLFSAGTTPALVWCVLGSAAVGAYAHARP
jgi:phosphoglycerol transferase MdoB-like AlkP superfamily enzyme